MGDCVLGLSVEDYKAFVKQLSDDARRAALSEAVALARKRAARHKDRATSFAASGRWDASDVQSLQETALETFADELDHMAEGKE